MCKKSHRTLQSSANSRNSIQECDKNLTVFLGGAGMVGGYIQDMVNAFKEVGIKNSTYGNYSSLITGLDQYLDKIPLAGESLDMGADAALLLFYNQYNDPIVLDLAGVGECKISSEKEFLGVKIRKYTYPSEYKVNSQIDCDITTVRIEFSKGSDFEFYLRKIGVNQPYPENGKFNLVGYSWGSVVVARTALFYAETLNKKVDNLVLIGAPINMSLLKAVQSSSNIKKVIVLNLGEHGDPIYAGMSDKAIIEAAPKLIDQMMKGEGHFYYGGDNDIGRKRRRELAKYLYNQGLK